jgi:hypothetical protein
MNWRTKSMDRNAVQNDPTGSGVFAPLGKRSQSE